jgi:hypothetical protein
MSEYLPKPMSVRQTEHMLRFLMMLFSMQLISENTFAETTIYFDDWTEFDAYDFEV